MLRLIFPTSCFREKESIVCTAGRLTSEDLMHTKNREDGNWSQHFCCVACGFFPGMLERS